MRRELNEFGGELGETINRVISSGQFVLGPEVEEFEHEFASYCRAKHCIGAGSGFDALQLLLRASDIGPGDEVIVPAYTAIATWMAVSAVGAEPVPVDIDPRTYNLNAECVSQAVTPKTRAVIPVHLFGQPVDIDPVIEIANQSNLLVFEDAAQAHGSRYKGARVGAFADGAAFSFYPTKNLGCLGDGGAITIDDDELASRLRLLRTCGWRTRDDSEILGLDSRLDELQAAILRLKLGHLDEWNKKRRKIASYYNEALSESDAIELPAVANWSEPVWHQFVIKHINRDLVKIRLSESGVETDIHYSPLPHLTKPYAHLKYSEGDLPVAEAVSREALSLPLYPQLTQSELQQITETLLSAAAE